MAFGQISGPLLNANLLRNGVNLSFETDLLFLDVNQNRVGINTKNPTTDLEISGTTKTTKLEATTAVIGELTFSTNKISSTNTKIIIEPTGTTSTVNLKGTLLINDTIKITDNTIQNNKTDTNLVLKANGTGKISVESNLTISDTLTSTSITSTTATLGSITITNNEISTTKANTNVKFVNNGTGYVKFDAANCLILSSGAVIDRPPVAETGMMRYNTEYGYLEIYNGKIWHHASGVVVTPEMIADIGMLSAILLT